MILKLTLKIFKKLLAAFGLLYGYNLIAPSTLLIPINFITIIFMTILSVPGLVILIIVKQIFI